MKKTLLATSALAFGLSAVAASASAVDVELYGQVNKGLFGYDDGQDTEFVMVDNDFSSTRFGVKGSQALDNGLTASVLFESEMQSNPSNLFTQNAATGTPLSNGNSSTTGTTTTFNERQARVGLSGDFGGVYLGQQSTAIDGILSTDLSGVQDVMGVSTQYIGGGLVYGGSGGTTVNRMSGLYATNREDSIRYDSPILMGLQARASIAQGGDPELAALYNGGYGDFKLAGALGYKASNGDASVTGMPTGVGYEERYDASFSAAHTSGLAATVAYQTYKVGDTGRKPKNWYTKVGYAWDAYELAADYGNTDGFTAGDQDAYGLGAQVNLGSGVSAAALYRRFALNDVTATEDQIDVFGVNMRVKF